MIPLACSLFHIKYASSCKGPQRQLVAWSEGLAGSPSYQKDNAEAFVRCLSNQKTITMGLEPTTFRYSE